MLPTQFRYSKPRIMLGQDRQLLIIREFTLAHFPTI